MSAGKILAQARIDAAKFTQSGGFQVDISLTTKDGNTTVLVQGTTSKRWVNFDNEGNSINAYKTHVTIAESSLNSVSYPVRNSNNKVALRGHKVSFLDNNGNLENYIIEEPFPNGTSGLIICMLGDSD